MQGILIFLLSIAAAILYGILHDHVTVRICLEYFTVAHPPIFGGTQNPNALAFGWGVIATWWVGAILGLPLACAARVGALPKRSARSLVRPIGILLMAMGFFAGMAGIAAYLLATNATNAGNPFFHYSAIAPDRQIPFFVDAVMHLTSYGVGFLGGIVLILWVIYARWRADVQMRLAQRQTALRLSNKPH